MIALLLGLQALPARFSAESVGIRAMQPLPSERRSVALYEGSRALGEGTWLVDGDRSHLAIRNALGQPTLILRVANGVVSMEVVGLREVVAPDAGIVMGELTAGTLGPEGVTRLILGRLPRGDARLVPVEEGFVAWDGPWLAHVDREGIVHQAVVGELGIIRSKGTVHLTDGVSSFRIELGAPESASIPAAAFDIGSEAHVPTISARRLSDSARRRLLGL